MNFIDNGNISRKYIDDKYVFWDIDGTLAPYRFNGHVGDLNSTNNGQSLKEIENGIFFSRKPSKFMQSVLNSCNTRKHIVMGHCLNQKEIDDKHKWLDMYYPCIKERKFILEHESKADAIIKYCSENDIDLADVVFVDDVISFLREAERKGISAWHISSFMDWFMK